MSARVFVDTNVLVYSRDKGAGAKQERAEEWRTALWHSGLGCLSVQVLHEYYVTVTRKLTPGMPRDRAQREVEDLAHWSPVNLTPRLLATAFEEEARHQLSFWDALILAAAREAECELLLSEDFQAGRDYAGVRVVSPFAVRPAEV